MQEQPSSSPNPGMTARRAVALTLLAVVLIGAVLAGGYLAYRGYVGYRDAVDRADKAEARAAAATRKADLAYDRGFAAGRTAGVDAAWNHIMGFVKEPGWYLAEVAEDGSPILNGRLSLKHVDDVVPCRPYWVDRDGETWSTTEDRCSP